MKYDPQRAQAWIREQDLLLPGLKSVLEESRSEVLIIGATVFGLYAQQGWMPPFRRATGDIDLSVGLVSGEEDYRRFHDLLLQKGYLKSPRTAYRYHFGQIPTKLGAPGVRAYIDVLAHPQSQQISTHDAIQAMGAGAEFSYAGFEAATLEPFRIFEHVSFPNPFGLLALKRSAYVEDPLRRVKDLADIIELVSGLVSQRTHFEMSELYKKVSMQPDIQKVTDMLQGLAREESVDWDIQNASQELLKRHYTREEVEETLRERMHDFCEMVLS